MLLPATYKIILKRIFHKKQYRPKSWPVVITGRVINFIINYKYKYEFFHNIAENKFRLSATPIIIAMAVGCYVLK